MVKTKEIAAKIACHHLIENFLPIRQAYIFDLIRSLDALAVTNEVWAYKASNQSVFDYEDVHAFGDENYFQRNLIRIRSKIHGSQTYLTDYFVSRSKISKPAVIHAHFLWMAQPLKELKKKISLPACVTAYGEDELFRAAITGELPKSLEIATDCADIIFTTSTYLLNIVKKLVGEEKARLWHIGVDVESYPRVAHSDKTQYIVLSVGRLIERKGFRFLVQAIPEILEQIPNTRFRIIGEGPEERNLLNLAKELNVSDSLEILSSQPSIKGYYASSDLFVLPSIITATGVTEGLGVPLLEAQASCLPVVASKVGGITDAVDNEKTGFLVSPSEPKELAAAILRTLSDAELRQRLGNAGRFQMQKEFMLTTQAQKLVSSYESLSARC
jgi:glycosyltransferase involved in cell wall biosynthesis